MISHDFKTIFFHVPKTAGTSIETSFGFVKKAKSGHTKLYAEYGLNGEKHFTAEDYKLKYPKEFEEYYKWTIVRNPWERELSFYLMQIKGAKYRHMSFLEWLEAVPVREHGQGVQKDQVDYFMIDGEIVVDDIYRFENLQISWRTVLNKINKEPIKLNWARNSKISRQSKLNYFNQKSIDLIAELRQRDIELLNYSFEDFKNNPNPFG